MSDRDFRFVAAPWITRCFGQTNYRAYVTDRETAEQVVWFFGTCLDSASVAIPRYLWRLPWHRAHMTFGCTLALGSYAIWHDRAAPSVGHLQETRYPLPESLGLVETGDLRPVHSVLLQPAKVG